MPKRGEFVPKRGEFVPRKYKQAKAKSKNRLEFVPIVPNAKRTHNRLIYKRLQIVCAKSCQTIWHDSKKHLNRYFSVCCKGEKIKKKGFVPTFAKCAFLFIFLRCGFLLTNRICNFEKKDTPMRKTNLLCKYLAGWIDWRYIVDYPAHWFQSWFEQAQKADQAGYKLVVFRVPKNVDDGELEKMFQSHFEK